MPWIISPNDASAKPPFKVKNKITGSVKGTHPSYAAAKKQLAALYVNVKEELQTDFTSHLDAILDEFTGMGATGGGQAGGSGTTSANVGSYAVPFPGPLRRLAKRKRGRDSNPIASVPTLQSMMRGK